jgi:hypothetical protein
MSDERAESVFTYITNAGSQGAGDFSTLGQNIEDARRLSGQTVTLSFWAWANIAGTNPDFSHVWTGWRTTSRIYP